MKGAIRQDYVDGADRSDTMLLGRLLLDAGKLTEIDVSRVVAAQRHKKLRFGEIAQDLGLVSDEDIRRALAQQFDYPYLSTESALDPRVVVAHDPYSQQAEDLRELRSQLLLRWFDERGRTLAVTAPRGTAGCGQLAANLAVVFAQLGQRTLLIDANFRNPQQQKLFGLVSPIGLSAVLADRCVLNDAILPIEPFENLSVISAGALPPNPQELLSRARFRDVVESVPKLFDAIIIDTPPVLEYADAQIAAAAAGSCLLATHRNSTRLADVERARVKLIPTRAVLLGAAITG